MALNFQNVKTTDCKQTAGNVTRCCLILSLLFAFAGCKQKDHEPGSPGKVQEQADASIGGQIFIVTKDRSNSVLGDVKVALLDESAMQAYFNAHALGWSNSLAEAQSKIDEATTNYDALYKDDLAKFKAAEDIHYNKMSDATASSQERQDAAEWGRKMKEKIHGLHRVKRASPEKTQLDEAVGKQASLWDDINWPPADHFEPKIDVVTTGSDGHFKFTVPKSSANSSLILLAKAQRQTGDGVENYWWLAKVDLRDKTSTEVILSNDNRSKDGVWGWLGDKGVKGYMSVYGLQIDSANEERSFKDKMEDAEDGVQN